MQLSWKRTIVRAAEFNGPLPEENTNRFSFAKNNLISKNVIVRTNNFISPIHTATIRIRKLYTFDNTFCAYSKFPVKF